MSKMRESAAQRIQYFTSPVPQSFRLEWTHILFLLLISAVTILICSEASPLYPVDDYVDANVYMTIGRSMTKGCVPYVDLYDQKGPLLFLLHALASFVSETSFLGIFFMEIAACFFYLYFAYRTIRLYVDSRGLFLIPLVSLITYFSPAFIHGDSCEEWSLPLLMMAVFIGLKNLRMRTVPTKKEWLAIGITSGCILWMKYTLLGFYAGWILVPAFMLVRHKKTGELLRGLLFVIGGVVISTVPHLIYYGIHGAIGEWLRVYFGDNLTLYSSLGNDGGIASILTHLWDGFLISLMNAPFVYVLMLVGLIWLFLCKETKTALFFILSLVLFHVTVYMGGRFYAYYSIDYAVFSVSGVIALGHFLWCGSHREIRRWVRRTAGVLLLVATAGVSFLFCKNRDLMFMNRSEVPLLQMRDVIEESGIADPTLLNYECLDVGLYNVCGIVPTCKYFHIPNYTVPGAAKAQDRMIEEGLMDFVVMRGGYVTSPDYELVLDAPGVFEGREYHYRLFQKRDETP